MILNPRGDARGIVLFRVGELRCGVHDRYVARIVRAVAPTPLNTAISFIEGVIDVHGTLVPVIDVRRRFGLAALPLEPEHHMILIAAGDRQAALRVDCVEDHLVAAEKETESFQLDIDPEARELGVARTTSGLLMIHDFDAFLTAEESAMLDLDLRSASEDSQHG